MAAPRIQIQDVRPQVDCGRYRAKACRGDPVPVAATIFRDGHERSAPPSATGRPGPARWREQPLEAQGNDQFAAVITPDALGPWEFRIQAWVDPYASWLDEHDRKLAAGQADLSGELSEGRLCSARAASRSGTGPRSASPTATARTSSRARCWE